VRWFRCFGSTEPWYRVYLGFDGATATGKTVAVKEIPIPNRDHGRRAAPEPRGVSRLAAAGDGARRDIVQIVMEFVASGSLAGLLRRAGTLREPVAAMYMRDMLCGLEYLHRSGICHGTSRAKTCSCRSRVDARSPPTARARCCVRVSRACRDDAQHLRRHAVLRGA
jgi:serine/threonine protein kinase